MITSSLKNVGELLRLAVFFERRDPKEDLPEPYPRLPRFEPTMIPGSAFRCFAIFGLFSKLACEVEYRFMTSST